MFVYVNMYVAMLSEWKLLSYWGLYNRTNVSVSLVPRLLGSPLSFLLPLSLGTRLM